MELQRSRVREVRLLGVHYLRTRKSPFVVNTEVTGDGKLNTFVTYPIQPLEVDSTLNTPIRFTRVSLCVERTSGVVVTKTRPELRSRLEHSVVVHVDFPFLFITATAVLPF